MGSGENEQEDAELHAGPTGPRVRTCVGCGERVDKAGAPREELVRLILGPGGEIAVDAGDGGFGRGAHVHPRPGCLAGAVQRGLAKAAKGRVHTILSGDSGEGESQPLRVETLALAIKAAMDRRVRGLLTAAARSRGLSLGADAVTSACERGDAALLVVACDAAAGADLTEVRRAVAEGRAVAWGTKMELGALCGGTNERMRGSGLSVIAVESKRIAAAVRDAVRAADACMGSAAAETASPRERGRTDRSSSEKRGGAVGKAPSSRVGVERAPSGAKSSGRPAQGAGAEAGVRAEAGVGRSGAAFAQGTRRRGIKSSKNSGDAARAAANRRVDG